jgi:hypothetical protein
MKYKERPPLLLGRKVAKMLMGRTMNFENTPAVFRRKLHPVE